MGGMRGTKRLILAAVIAVLVMAAELPLVPGGAPASAAPRAEEAPPLVSEDLVAPEGDYQINGVTGLA